MPSGADSLDRATGRRSPPASARRAPLRSRGQLETAATTEAWERAAWAVPPLHRTGAAKSRASSGSSSTARVALAACTRLAPTSGLASRCSAANSWDNLLLRPRGGKSRAPPNHARSRGAVTPPRGEGCAELSSSSSMGEAGSDLLPLRLQLSPTVRCAARRAGAAQPYRARRSSGRSFLRLREAITVATCSVALSNIAMRSIPSAMPAVRRRADFRRRAGSRTSLAPLRLITERAEHPSFAPRGRAGGSIRRPISKPFQHEIVGAVTQHLARSVSISATSSSWGA